MRQKKIKRISICIAASLLLFASCSEDDVTIQDDEVQMGECLKIGDMREGGIVFYIDSTNEHGLIAATMDQSEGAPWGCAGALQRFAQQRDIGFGSTNTEAILTNCKDVNIAAKICSDLELNGYDDWFLPTINEMRLLEHHKNSVGGFALGGTSIYATSTELGGSLNNNETVKLFAVDFSNNPVSPDHGIAQDKSALLRVRAIRKF